MEWLDVVSGLPLNGQGGNCIATSQSSAGNQSITACLTASVTYYLILDVYPSPTCNPFTNLTISAPVPAGGCVLGAGVVNITLPYISSGRTTCGKINDLTPSNTISCGSSNYFTGEDEVFVFTPATSGNINISITSTGSYTGMMLYNGCPNTASCSGTAGTCVAFEQSSTGGKTMCANVMAGQTYYLVIDSWSTPVCNPFNISISAPTAMLPGATCANAISISSLPFSILNESTACTGNDYTNLSSGSCGTLFESGEDKVYSYTALASECISITLSGASSNSIGYQVYSGCPGAAGTTCIGSNGSANSGILTGSVILPSAGTYYIVIDSWAPPTNVSYNLSIVTYGSGAPNDLPCNATPLILGIPLSSANNCSGGAGEPPLPTCWTTPNVMNSVWFSIQAPASGQLRIKVIPGSLTNPQSILYSGVCGTAMSQYGCNDNAASCGFTTNYSSEMLITALTPGVTYYIMVDGNANLTGTFSILALDGTAIIPPLSNGQDCGNYLAVCDTSMSFGDPGFQSFGNICDFPGGGSNCLQSGERGSVWFDIPINANGFLEFSIVPKDWPGAPSTAGTDYDFALWKIQGSGAVTCAQIATGAAPVACNYSLLGVTGLYSNVNNTAPPQYPGFNVAFNTRYAVNNGDRYALVVSNFSNSTSGFDIVFSNTSPILYGSMGNASVWSGGIDTDWFKKENWGGCPVPTCLRDATINGGIVLQPTIAGIATCKSIVINPGATLTIPGGQTLSVCEHFTNLGILSAAATSTLWFGNAAVNQNINGNLTGSNAFGNVVVTKTGGVVTALQAVDVRGNFTVSNATSAFDANGRYHKVAGNFTNLGTYTPNGNTLELNGSVAQTYNNVGTINHFVMNHSGPGATLATNLILGTSGNLSLTNGRIITTASYEVIVNNRSSAAAGTGNMSSFVQGYLRRYLNSTGSYDFPVGEASKGYQRANINFAYAGSPTVIDNLRVNFVTYAVLPTPLGVVDCGLIYSSNALNNGRWIFAASNSPTSGNFDLTLYNTGYTNAANAWTIMANSGGPWTLANGTCVLSPVTAVRRNAMNGLYEFGTAQGPSALPVQWLSVNARALDKRIQINWATASEENNSGFEVEKLNASNKIFESIGWVDGAGNSNQVNYYSFDDVNVEMNEDYFYKIKQVDFNGASSYSDIVHARINTMNNSMVQLYPNPIKADSKLVFDLVHSTTVKISIVNVLGEVLKQENLGNLKQGNYTINITSLFSNLKAGLYTVQVDLDSKTEHFKVLYINQ
ncbi:MAG: T9SS type A sorting domain-containing protein [Bacteroidetes bacterium]|nr:T9SS type A sorting domain-containing protein [Bacteroidota bacterium]